MSDKKESSTPMLDKALEQAIPNKIIDNVKEPISDKELLAHRSTKPTDNLNTK